MMRMFPFCRYHPQPAGWAFPFEGLAPADLNWPRARAHRRLFAAGTNILTAEQPGEAVYVILHGTVKIHVEQSDGRDVVLAILGAGDTLGEMSLIDSAGRSASAVTLEDSLLLWMDKSAFQEALRRFPVLAQNLVRILSARVRLANELIQALASMDVNGRVARQLLAFADKYGRAEGQSVLIPIHLTQSDIADLAVALAQARQPGHGEPSASRNSSPPTPPDASSSVTAKR